MKTRFTQAGKGLAGFIVGLVLATAVIAGVLFFLNKGKSDFKQPNIQTEPSAPEILTPSGAASTTLPTEAAAASAAASAPVGSASQPGAGEQPQNHSTPIQPHSSGSAAHQPAPVKKPMVTKNHQTPVSPEAILNNGSLEKAQQAAKSSDPASGAVLLQIGAYNSRNEADAQRAKLAILGINTSIHTASVKGKTVYRVQTGTLSRSQAGHISRQLQQQNIPSLLRTAP